MQLPHPIDAFSIAFPKAQIQRTYLDDTMAPISANEPPTIGKNKVLDVSVTAPINNDNDTPKQRPGNKAGSNTPNDIPTNAAWIDKIHSATLANSIPTGTNNGSKKINVMNPDTIVDNIPEKYRELL